MNSYRWLLSLFCTLSLSLSHAQLLLRDSFETDKTAPVNASLIPLSSSSSPRLTFMAQQIEWYIDTPYDSRNAWLYDRVQVLYEYYLRTGDDMGAGKNIQAQEALIYAIDPNTQDVINSVYVGNDWRHVGPNFAFHLPVKQHQKVHLKVIWPSGFEQSQLFTNIDSNQTYRIQYRQDRDDVLSLWQAGNGW